MFSRVWLCDTPWIVAHQAPLSMGFSRQGYWSGLLCPPPGIFLHLLHLLHCRQDWTCISYSSCIAGDSLPIESPWKPPKMYMCLYIYMDIYTYIYVVQSLSSVQFCNPMDYSTPSFPVLHCLLEFAQIHGCWVGDAIWPSHPLPPSSPLAFNLS